MTELVYYVTQDDHPTGETEEKYAAHHANTRLHAAFSVYVFNDKGQLLVTQRAFSKKVWPGVWTNTCCGHPGDIQAGINAGVEATIGFTKGFGSMEQLMAAGADHVIADWAFLPNLLQTIDS